MAFKSTTKMSKGLIIIFILSITWQMGFTSDEDILKKVFKFSSNDFFLVRKASL